MKDTIENNNQNTDYEIISIDDVFQNLQNPELNNQESFNTLMTLLQLNKTQEINLESLDFKFSIDQEKLTQQQHEILHKTLSSLEQNDFLIIQKILDLQNNNPSNYCLNNNNVLKARQQANNLNNKKNHI